MNGVTYTNTVTFQYDDFPSLIAEVELYYAGECYAGYGVDNVIVFERTFQFNVDFDSPEFSSETEKTRVEEISTQLTEDSMNALNDFIFNSIGVIF